ncbi:MAG: hypothetical protein NTU49_06280 [Gammaproteobacteria bacterium]|nr:hypothetical protein [Gammaproteobacteria bacterium]
MRSENRFQLFADRTNKEVAAVLSRMAREEELKDKKTFESKLENAASIKTTKLKPSEMFSNGAESRTMRRKGDVSNPESSFEPKLK